MIGQRLRLAQEIEFQKFHKLNFVQIDLSLILHQENSVTPTLSAFYLLFQPDITLGLFFFSNQVRH